LNDARGVGLSGGDDLADEAARIARRLCALRGRDEALRFALEDHSRLRAVERHPQLP
jgi:hypothetical protein